MMASESNTSKDQDELKARVMASLKNIEARSSSSSNEDIERQNPSRTGFEFPTYQASMEHSNRRAPSQAAYSSSYQQQHSRQGRSNGTGFYSQSHGPSFGPPISAYGGGASGGGIFMPSAHHHLQHHGQFYPSPASMGAGYAPYMMNPAGMYAHPASHFPYMPPKHYPYFHNGFKRRGPRNSGKGSGSKKYNSEEKSEAAVESVEKSKIHSGEKDYSLSEEALKQLSASKDYSLSEEALKQLNASFHDASYSTTMPISSEVPASSSLSIEPMMNVMGGESAKMRLLIQEYQKQHNLLVETQSTLEKIVSLIKQNHEEFDSNLLKASESSKRIERLKLEIQQEQELNLKYLADNKGIQSIIENLNIQLAATEKLMNNLNENVVKKKLLISQLQSKSDSGVSSLSANSSASGAGEKTQQAFSFVEKISKEVDELAKKHSQMEAEIYDFEKQSSRAATPNNFSNAQFSSLPSFMNSHSTHSSADSLAAVSSAPSKSNSPLFGMHSQAQTTSTACAKPLSSVSATISNASSSSNSVVNSTCSSQTNSTTSSPKKDPISSKACQLNQKQILKNDYSKKIRDAYHSVLKSKLSLFKKQNLKSKILPIAEYLNHISQMFQGKSCGSNPETSSENAQYSHSSREHTSSFLIENGNELVSLDSICGLVDLNESNSILNEDPDYSLEKYFTELVFYYYLLKEHNLEGVKNELLSIASPGNNHQSFNLLNALEKFVILLINVDFYPHIFKDIPKYDFVPLRIPPFDMKSLKNEIESQVPFVEARIFSRQVLSFLKDSRAENITDFTSFEDAIQSDPTNSELWINFALSMLPCTMNLENAHEIPKENFPNCLATFSRAIEENNTSEEIWIAYLDIFSIYCAKDQTEINDIFSSALQYAQDKFIFSLMHISHSADISTKISLAKDLLISCQEACKLENTASSLLLLLELYFQAGYVDCALSLVNSLFFSSYSSFEQCMKYDEEYQEIADSFDHSSFVNIFFHENQTVHILLWLCIVHFLFFQSLPCGLFFEYPFEFFPRLDLKFLINFSMIPGEKHYLKKIVGHVFDFLIHNSKEPNNPLLQVNYQKFTMKIQSPSSALAFNQSSLMLPQSEFNQAYASHIKEFVPAIELEDPLNLNFILKVIQRSLGIYSDFEKLPVNIPNQKNSFLAWINYIAFLLKNPKLLKGGDGDMEQNFDYALNTLQGMKRIVFWKEFIAWTLLCRPCESITPELERFVRECIESRHFHASMHEAKNTAVLEVIVNSLMKKFTSCLDSKKKDLCMKILPPETIPMNFWQCKEYKLPGLVLLLQRFKRIPSCYHLFPQIMHLIQSCSPTATATDNSLLSSVQIEKAFRSVHQIVELYAPHCSHSFEANFNSNAVGDPQIEEVSDEQENDYEELEAEEEDSAY